MKAIVRTYFLVSLLSGVLSSCSSPHLIATETHQYVMSDSLYQAVDSSVYLSAEPFRVQLIRQMSEVLCTSETAMEKGVPDGALGNFVSDVCLEMGNRKLKETEGSLYRPADVVILNNGGLRKPLPAGPVSRGDFYEVMPFENQLVVLTCSGRLMQEICEFIASKGGTPVSGIRFTIDASLPLPLAVNINGAPLDTSATYLVMTADYLANGGDQFELFKSAEKRMDTGLKIRDALIEYSREKGRKGESISARSDVRIRYEHE